MLDARLRVVDKEGPVWTVRKGRNQAPLASARTQREATRLATEQLANGSGGMLEVYTASGALKTRFNIQPLDEATTATTWRSRLLSLIKKPVVWGSGIVLAVTTATVTGQLTPLFEDVADRLTRSGDAVLVNNLKISQNLPLSMALPAGVKVTDEEAFQRADRSWLESKGAVPVGDLSIQLTVTGNRRNAVRIMDIAAVKQCQEPLNGAYFEQSSQGGSPSLMLVMDMDDDPSPRAMYPPLREANGDKKTPLPYFDENTVTLKDGEQYVVNLTVRTDESYCTFVLELSVLEGNTVVPQRINNNGKPFSITPYLEWKEWQRPYISGLNCTGRGLRGFVPVNRASFTDVSVSPC